LWIDGQAYMTLDEHAAAFEEHGAVRDLYVLDTTSHDWQRLLDHLRTGRHVRLEQSRC
jgi:hypothetical protein